MTDDGDDDFFRRLEQSLRGSLARRRDKLVPPAFQFLLDEQVPRYIVLYGGRAAAKSWSIARVLLLLAHATPLRVLCCREIQGSIKESAYRLLADQIADLQLDDFFDVQSDSITGRTGGRFFFEGLRYNAAKIRSYEGVDIVWVEEAQNVSDLSWETLLPTIRKKGSRFYVSFNPMLPPPAGDPAFTRFVASNRADVLVRKVSWRDNPYLSAEAIAEKDWLERTDIDAYRHVWEGEPRTVSEALILRGKYSVEPFEVNPAWPGPYHGLDYGFSADPSAAVRCYIDTDTRTLYIDREFWALGADIDALPGALESAIPAISRHVVYADSARPETTGYLASHGISNARSAEKWPGSVDDGIAYLRSFARIVIDPSCRRLIDECGRYSFKCDRLTGIPLPEPIDAHNHCIDALRYALSPLIRNQPSGGYFLREAMLVDGEPVEPGGMLGRPQMVFATAATCERSGAIGLVYWAGFPHFGAPFVALDYELVEVAEALGGSWLPKAFARAQELREEWGAIAARTTLRVEQGELHQALTRVFIESVFNPHLVPQPYDLVVIESKKLLPTLDERASAARANINGGKYVKLARSTYARQVTHRSVTPANHLVNQVLGFRPGSKDGATELVNAFLLAFALPWQPPGVLPRVEATLRAGVLPPPPAAAPPPPRPRPQPMALLKPGRRVIDGVAVDVPGTGDGRELVWFPLSAGFHVVDGIGLHVPAPGVGITLP